MIDEGGLEKVVVAETADGQFVAIGQMVGYYSHPSAVIRLPDGSLMSWSASIIREATVGERYILHKLAPAQNTCTHDKSCGRLVFTQNLLLCGRCRKAVEE